MFDHAAFLTFYTAVLAMQLAPGPGRIAWQERFAGCGMIGLGLRLARAGAGRR